MGACFSFPSSGFQVVGFGSVGWLKGDGGGDKGYAMEGMEGILLGGLVSRMKKPRPATRRVSVEEVGRGCE